MFGTEFRFGGQENSTLHSSICIVEKRNTLCIFGLFLWQFPCGIQGKTLEEPGYFRQRGGYSNSDRENFRTGKVASRRH